MPELMSVAGPDGRRLEVEVAGPEYGTVLLAHAGTPSAGRSFAPIVETAAERGLRHLTYSRPGYGESDRNPGRTVADCAEDVAAIADALGIERMFVVGTSGGGPHALACAALLGDRVIAAATVAGVAPADAEDLDWLGGMGEENVEEFAAARGGEEQLRAYLEGQAREMAGASPSALEDALGDLLSDVDRGALTGNFAEYLAGAVSVALSHGIWGWFDDDIAFVSDWGFSLEDITTPVTVWQGKQDRFVPWSHGDWLGHHVGGALLEVRPEHGHLSLGVAAFGEVLDGLLAH